MGLPRLGVRRRLRAAALAVLDARHWAGLRRLRGQRPADYREYLAVQLRRTLSKRDYDPGVGARVLIDRVAGARGAAGGSVLCVGCRNGVELDEFRARGFARVVGIDLFSQRKDIQVMDMHAMTFPDDAFDVVYSSHSLEHAYDVDAVVREIARVARDGAIVGVEVPLRVRASEADRVEFGGMEELRAALGSGVGEVLWADEQPPRSKTNGQGTAVARLVLRLEKERGEAPQAAARPVPGYRRRRPALVLAMSAVLALLPFAWIAKALVGNDYDII